MIRLKKPVSASVSVLIFRIFLILLLFSMRPLLGRLLELERITVYFTEIVIVVIWLYLPRITKINISETLDIKPLLPMVRAVLAGISLIVPPIAAQFLPDTRPVRYAVLAVCLILVIPAISPKLYDLVSDLDHSPKGTIYPILILGALYFVYMFLFSIFYDVAASIAAGREVLHNAYALCSPC